jgi:hypothetical protein
VALFTVRAAPSACVSGRFERKEETEAKMTTSETGGRWTSLFKKQTKFNEELSQAREIGARWERSPYQRDIILDEIPGWLPPLWGSDTHWLYIRRPEGIWKTKIPVGFGDSTPILLYQNRTSSAGTRPIGALSIGADLINQGGWNSAQSKKKASAYEMDLKRHPTKLGVTLDVEAIGQELWEALPSEREGLLLRAGDDFYDEPIFKLRGDWLIAQDPKTGWQIAYLLESSSDARKALDAGTLWLRFRSPWLRTLDVRVPPLTALVEAV